MLTGTFIGILLFVIGAIIAIIKPKPNKESLDWLGGFIAGGGIIVFLACFSAYLTSR